MPSRSILVSSASHVPRKEIAIVRLIGAAFSAANEDIESVLSGA
jgi:hypothetical protein